MHGKTFNILKGGESVTVWGEGKHRGRHGYVVSTTGNGRNGLGRVLVRLEGGGTTEEAYPHVAYGDNSYSKYPDNI